MLVPIAREKDGLTRPVDARVGHPRPILPCTWVIRRAKDVSWMVPVETAHHIWSHYVQTWRPSFEWRTSVRAPACAAHTSIHCARICEVVYLCPLLIVDHAPLTIVASYAGARLWTVKSVVLMKDLIALRQESRTYLGFIYCNCRSLILTNVIGRCG